MSDLIRRSDAIMIVRERLDSPHMQNIWQQGACLSILRAIENAPTIEPKRGKWIVKQSGFAECSVCERHYFSDYNFCPMCGADMRGGHNE